MSMSMLSDDLVEEILSRVPATSLILSRSTCKQWNALFNDHKFTKKHFDRAPKESLVLMTVGLEVNLVNLDLSGFQNNTDPSIELKGDQYGVFSDICPISHCNGLLLSYKRNMEYNNRFWYMEYNKTLIVSNPCMGQIRLIETMIGFRKWEDIALGYQNDKSCSANYKILMFGWRSTPGDYVFDMYDLVSNSWRVLRDVSDDDWFVGPHCRGISFKGNTYWIALDKKDYYDTFLLQFDFTKERFQRSRLPFKCDCDYDTVVLSNERDKQLGMFFQRHFESTMEIWLTKEIDDESLPWRLLFRVDSGHKSMLNQYYLSFMVDEENKVALCFFDECIEENRHNQRTILYVVVEGKKVIRLIGPPVPRDRRPMRYLFSYVPSLLQI